MEIVDSVQTKAWKISKIAKIRKSVLRKNQNNGNI